VLVLRIPEEKGVRNSVMIQPFQASLHLHSRLSCNQLPRDLLGLINCLNFHVKGTKRAKRFIEKRRVTEEVTPNIHKGRFSPDLSRNYGKTTSSRCCVNDTTLDPRNT
jgi:hypothetical protein